jgi:hypothetical protein
MATAATPMILREIAILCVCIMQVVILFIYKQRHQNYSIQGNFSIEGKIIGY